MPWAMDSLFKRNLKLVIRSLRKVYAKLYTRVCFNNTDPCTSECVQWKGPINNSFSDSLTYSFIYLFTHCLNKHLLSAHYFLSAFLNPLNYEKNAILCYLRKITIFLIKGGCCNVWTLVIQHGSMRVLTLRILNSENPLCRCCPYNNIAHLL